MKTTALLALAIVLVGCASEPTSQTTTQPAGTASSASPTSPAPAGTAPSTTETPDPATESESTNKGLIQLNPGDSGGY
jgi:PBP1b-binding outer membrane lipoprotein LpoB